MNENQFDARQKEEIRLIIREELQEFFASDRYIFHKNIQVLNGRNFIFSSGQNAGDGTKIGTAANQKLAFFGAEPCSQESYISIPTMINLGGTYNELDLETNFNRIVSTFDDILALLENFGFMASS